MCWCGYDTDRLQDEKMQVEEANELAAYMLEKSEQEAAAAYVWKRDAYVTKMEAKQTGAEEEAVRKAETQERASGL